MARFLFIGAAVAAALSTSCATTTPGSYSPTTGANGSYQHQTRQVCAAMREVATTAEEARRDGVPRNMTAKFTGHAAIRSGADDMIGALALWAVDQVYLKDATPAQVFSTCETEGMPLAFAIATKLN